jgi:cell division septation protein DedD
MLKTIFKVLLVILAIGLIFTAVMWAMQPPKSTEEKSEETPLSDKKKLGEAKDQTSMLLGKVKLPLGDILPGKEPKTKEKPKKSLEKESKDISRAEKAKEQATNSKYFFPKELLTDRLSYTLHIDAFLNKEFADQLIGNLKRKKYHAYGTGVWNEKKQLWHAVRVGRYLDIETANEKLSEFNLNERRSARIISLGTLEFYPPDFLKPDKTKSSAELTQKKGAIS